MFTFGYQMTEDVLKDYEVAWGARMIWEDPRRYETPTFSLLHDRQSMFVHEDGLLQPMDGFMFNMTQHHKDRMIGLASLLNEGGLLAYLRCRMQAEALKGNLDYANGKEIELLDFWGVHAVCNTNSSHGYVYIRVGIRKLAQSPVQKQVEDLNEGECVWSASLLPRVGESVEMTHDRGTGTVCSYFVEHKHLHCMVQGGKHRGREISPRPLPSFKELEATWSAFQKCPVNAHYPDDGMEWVKKQYEREGAPIKVLLPTPWSPCAAGYYSPTDFIEVTNIMGREWHPIQKKEIA